MSVSPIPDVPPVVAGRTVSIDGVELLVELRHRRLQMADWQVTITVPTVTEGRKQTYMIRVGEDRWPMTFFALVEAALAGDLSAWEGIARWGYDRLTT